MKISLLQQAAAIGIGILVVNFPLVQTASGCEKNDYQCEALKSKNINFDLEAIKKCAQTLQAEEVTGRGAKYWQARNHCLEDGMQALRRHVDRAAEVSSATGDEPVCDADCAVRVLPPPQEPSPK